MLSTQMLASSSRDLRPLLSYLCLCQKPSCPLDVQTSPFVFSALLSRAGPPNRQAGSDCQDVVAERFQEITIVKASATRTAPSLLGAAPPPTYLDRRACTSLLALQEGDVQARVLRLPPNLLRDTRRRRPGARARGRPKTCLTAGGLG